MTWVDYAEFMFPSIINAILDTVKNPEKNKKWRLAILKVYRAIKAANLGDPDFT